MFQPERILHHHCVAKPFTIRPNAVALVLQNCSRSLIGCKGHGVADFKRQIRGFVHHGRNGTPPKKMREEAVLLPLDFSAAVDWAISQPRFATVVRGVTATVSLALPKSYIFHSGVDRSEEHTSE